MVNVITTVSLLPVFCLETEADKQYAADNLFVQPYCLSTPLLVAAALCRTCHLS